MRWLGVVALLVASAAVGWSLRPTAVAGAVAGVAEGPAAAATATAAPGTARAVSVAAVSLGSEQSPPRRDDWSPARAQAAEAEGTRHLATPTGGAPDNGRASAAGREAFPSPVSPEAPPEDFLRLSDSPAGVPAPAAPAGTR